MKTASIKDDLSAELDKLPYDLQKRVLDFTRSLARRGVKGEDLLRFEGAISTEDLKTMSEVIADECETVDNGEW